MLLSDHFYYDKKHLTKIDQRHNGFYYVFDYDQRESSLNMEFQHFHPFYEIIIMLDNDVKVQIEGQNYQTKAGDLVLFKPSILHKTIYPKGTPSKRILINFHYDLGSSPFSQALKTLMTMFHTPEPVYRFDTVVKERITEEMNQIFRLTKSQAFSEDDPIEQMILHNHFTTLLHTIYTHRHESIYANVANHNYSIQKVHDICSYIHTHYQQDISLSSLSERFYISSSYLSRHFKEVTGYNVTDYIQQTRVKNAQILLLTTNDSISTISEKSGFSSFSQFNRVFKKFNNQSPSNFKKSGYI